MISVFLDFDGVLNGSGTYRRWRAAGGDLVRNRNHRLDLLFEPRCVAAANLLIRLLGDPAVVLSTSWREEHPRQDLAALLASVGFGGRVVGATPIRDDGRGAEIVAYCVERGIDTEDILIIEDEEDVSPLRHRQIMTTFRGPRPGLGGRHVRAAIRLLTKNTTN